METWRQVIVEWVNCLEIVEIVIKELKELEDGTFYKKLLDLLSWTDNKSISGDDIVTKFIEAEYPDFIVDNEYGIRGMDQLYIASLILLYASQKPILHKPMCTNLQHEAQVKIKTFLELSIPYGKNLTKEVLEDAIKELGDATFRTPKTPKTTRGLKDFLNSPVVHSARSHRMLSDQTREIRKLRAELEAGKYEKADLYEDLEMYKNKVQNLQRKLQEKSTEMKALRDQQLMPSTPQSCKKDKNGRKNFSQYEKHYKKEIDRLEEALMNKQKEMDTLEEDNEKLTKKLTGMERQCLFFRDKLESNEKTIENLQAQNETKDCELLCLKTTNEELRAYLDEMSKSTASEQSFEMECGISGLQFPVPSLNQSEALSSVIELQLKEVTEESASLKAQLEVLNNKLDSMTKENKQLMDLNVRLEKDSLMLRAVQEKLDHTLEKLSVSNTEVENLHQERESLLSQNEKLNAELQKLADVEKELIVKNQSNKELGVALKESKDRLNETILTVERLEQENNTYSNSIKSSYAALKQIIVETSNDIITENNNVDETMIMDFISNIGKMLNDSKSETNIMQTQILVLKGTLNEANLKVSSLISHTDELKKTNETYEHNISDLKEELAQCNDTILELKQSREKLVEEIDRLNGIKQEKNNLEEKLEKLLDELTQKDSMLMDMKTEKDNLTQDLFATKEKLNTQKQELDQLQECQRNTEESYSKLSRDYNLLAENFTKEEVRRKEIEKKFTRNEEKLNRILDMKASLESQLLEKQRVNESTESTLTKLRDDLHELTQSFEEIKFTKNAQEQQYNIMTSEKTKELECLKSDNDNLKSELKNTKNKLTLLQQQTKSLSDQITSQNERIASLVSDNSILQVEKDHLSRLQTEVESKTNVFLKELESQLLKKQRSYDQLSLQAKLKEETVELLGQKFENVTKDRIATELKMKEVIMNLQEVRSNQAAVLATQEKALKEKALHMEQLEKEFRVAKDLLQKQIENEKTLHCNLQSTCSELQNQSSKQMKTIEELEELLKKERSEHDTTKKYLHDANTSNTDILNACDRMKCLADDLKSTIKEVAPDTSNFYSNAENNVYVRDDDKVRNILSIINNATEEMEASHKLLSHLHSINVSLKKVENDHQSILEDHIVKSDKVKLLQRKVEELETLEEKRVKQCRNLVKYNTCLMDFLNDIMKSRGNLDACLAALEVKWKGILTRLDTILTANTAGCNELEEIHRKKRNLEEKLHKYNICHSENMKPSYTILWNKFLWIKEQLEKMCSVSVSDTANIDDWMNAIDSILTDDRTKINTELKRNNVLEESIGQLEKEIDIFSNETVALQVSFDNDPEKFKSEEEKKLLLRVTELLEEKCDTQNTLKALRARTAQLDEHVNMQRDKINEIKSGTVPLEEAEDLRKDLKSLKLVNTKLREEQEELKKRPTLEEVDKRIKEIHEKYESKIDDVKQKMKSAFNEQLAKLHTEQATNLREQLELLQGKMEQQCRKQAEEINRYRTHVSGLSSQFWNVGEKLLTEQQQKQELEKELNELKAKYENLKLKLTQQAGSSVEQKNIKLERRDFPTSSENIDQVFQKISVVREKTTYERRCSIQSLQKMGNAFNAEDEEGEVFDNIYLADMKNGHQSFLMDPDRLSVLKMRNSLCKPHLKSSYPAEMQFNPLPFTEEEIKTGSVSEDVFNDSLSQSLLPEQKARKKDRTQTSYKKPGPPTPSKNGGRLSLQGNELRSPNSKILRERNKDRATATPRTLKSLFSSRCQDENAASTPKGGRRRSGFFSKSRNTANR